MLLLRTTDANSTAPHPFQPLPLKARHPERLLPRHQPVLEAVIQPPRVLPVDLAVHAEVLDLASKLGRELGCVEARDEVDAARTGEELVVEHVDIVAENGAQAHPGDDDALLWVGLAGGGGAGGGGAGGPALPPGSWQRKRCECVRACDREDVHTFVLAGRKDVNTA